jgi:hypothetical protein
MKKIILVFIFLVFLPGTSYAKWVGPEVVFVLEFGQHGDKNKPLYCEGDEAYIRFPGEAYVSKDGVTVVVDGCSGYYVYNGNHKYVMRKRGVVFIGFLRGYLLFDYGHTFKLMTTDGTVVKEMRTLITGTKPYVVDSELLVVPEWNKKDKRMTYYYTDEIGKEFTKSDQHPGKYFPKNLHKSVKESRDKSGKTRKIDTWSVSFGNRTFKVVGDECSKLKKCHPNRIDKSANLYSVDLKMVMRLDKSGNVLGVVKVPTEDKYENVCREKKVPDWATEACVRRVEAYGNFTLGHDGRAYNVSVIKGKAQVISWTWRD